MILHEHIANTLEITINSGKGNLLSLTHIQYLDALVAKAETDCTIHGLIITGTGRSFSTGLDLSNEFPSSGAPARLASFQALDALLVRLFGFSKPCVAAVNGHAVGAGFLIQLCADQAISADNARIKMGLPELSLGLTIDPVMAHLARHGFPNNRILQKSIYSGDLFGHTMALQIGVVDAVVPDDELMDASRNMISHLLRGGSAAFDCMKQTLRRDTLDRMADALASHSHRIFDKLLRELESKEHQ